MTITVPLTPVGRHTPLGPLVSLEPATSRPAPRPVTPRPVAPRRRPGTDPRPMRALAILLGAAALVLLPTAAAGTDLGALGGLGLAGVLPVAAWAAVGFAVAACLVELLGPAPSARVLGGLTAVLALCTTGLASVVEAAARMPVAWLHQGFVDAIAAAGRVPTSVDSRFSWAGFFAQWAWIRDAAGITDLDAVLRFTPPVVALVWATAVLVLARRLIGGVRAPWVAAWLFLGLNWIEQDYFSPQAAAMVMVVAVWVVALGPLATSRAPLTGSPLTGSPLTGFIAGLAARLRALPRLVTGSPDRWRSPHPATPPRVVLAAWAFISLCLAALAVSHQLTPFALLAQLAVLVVAGRLWGGRGLVVVLLVAVVTWIVLGGQEFWLNQLALATGDVGNAGGSVTSALADRLVGDPGQLAVKAARVLLALGTVGLGAVGAWIRWRRHGELVWLPLALAPAGLVLVQSYGGEVFLRVLLYALPFLAVLGAEALRALRHRWRRVGTVVLVIGAAVLFAALVTVRGGNDAYVSLTPAEVSLTRQVLDAAPAGSTVLPLSPVVPMLVDRVGEVAQTPTTCDALWNDPVRCALADRPLEILSLPVVDAEGVVLRGERPGWSRTAMLAIAATGQYRVTHDDGGLALVLTRTTS
jgi:hypothetical protein